MTYTELSKTFNEGEIAVYPSFGVCRIIEREERNGISYLKLESRMDNSTVLIPEEKAQSLGLRHLESRENVLLALSSLSDRSFSVKKEWKIRIGENQNLLREGSIMGEARVVNCLYRLHKTKTLPTQEKKLYDTALSRLLDEASFVLDKDSEEMRKIVFSKLENV